MGDTRDKVRVKPEPRGKPRAKVDITCEIGGLKGAAIGQVRDLTEEGLRIFSPHNYAVGDRLGVTLQIPGFAQRFDFAVVVRRIDMAGMADLFELGCQFAHTGESAKLLKDLLWELHAGNLPEIQRKPGSKKTTRRIVKR